MASASPLLYYHIQNDRGEDSAHPNAAALTPSAPGRVTFGDVLAAFPYSSATSSFHFRFQVTHERALCYADLPTLDADTAVPLVNGNVVAKVLRLNTLRSAAGRAAADGALLLQQRGAPRPLVYRPGASGNVMPSAPAASRGGADGDASGGGGGESTGGGAVSPRAAAALAAMMPQMNALRHEVPKEVDGDVHIRDDGTAPDIYAGLKAVDARGMRPVKAVSDSAGAGAALEPPAVVDEDLVGKSAFVQAAVMARRAEVARKVEELRVEAAEREEGKADNAAAMEAARASHEQRIREWACEQGGAVRPVRSLLMTLDKVLWEGAKWEPVSMAKLVIPAKVKLSFLKAITVVHPDKAAGLGAEKAYIANQVFHKLEEAWRHFQETEMN